MTLSSLDYRIFALHYINEREDLTPLKKGELIKSIIEADEQEIFHLLEDEKKSIIPAAVLMMVAAFLGVSLTQPTQYGAGYYAGKIAGKMPGIEFGMRAGGTRMLALGFAGGIAFSVLVAAIISLSLKQYQRHFVAFAKTCQSLKGQKKNECIKEAKKSAIKERIRILTRGLALANRSKDPQKVRARLYKRIAKERKKLESL